MREIRSAVREILVDRSNQEAVVGSEEAGWNQSLWELLTESGFAGISVDEEIGGSGGSVAEAVAVLYELGRSSASVPFAEHALLGGWLMSLAGRPIPSGIVTVAEDFSTLQASADADGGMRVQGELRHVPWGEASDHVIVLVSHDGADKAVLLSSADLSWRRGSNLAQELRSHATIDECVVSAENVWDVPDGTRMQLRLRGALSRAALMTGALERVMELTVRYTSEREQFGRPIARFQAVQRHLVRLAEMAQQSMMATTVAALNAHEELDFFEVASAKIVAGESASGGTAAAHQAHGAIGMTKEYELGQLSRRLWSWRDEYGPERGWGIELGEMLANAGAAALWPRITEGLQPAGEAHA